MITVDIQTKIIASDQKVVIARPGADYRLYSDFVEENLVGPELPALFLESEAIDPKSEDMIARIRRSRERRSWHKRGSQTDSIPTTEIDEYDNFSNSQSTRQFLRLIDFYFRDAKRGDIIVIPPKPLSQEAYIGEFIDNPEDAFLWNCRFYMGDPLPARRVKWLGKIPKIDLPANVLDALKTPTALFSFRKSELDLVYRRAYRNYRKIDGAFSSVFDVTSSDFNTFHGSVIPGFFNFVAANTRSVIESGEASSFAEGAFANLGSYTPELAVDIQSPGILAIASQYVTPLVASALLAIAVSVGPSAALEDVIPTIRIGNSSAPADDPCVLEVQQQVYAQLRLLGYDRWSQACQLLKQAADQTGLSSESIVKK